MNYKYYTIVILGLLAFSACEKDDIDIPATDNEVNQWIEQTMRENYLWYSEFPDKSSLDFSLDPESFFKGLLSYKDGKELSDGHHYFSQLEKATVTKSIYDANNSYGFDFATSNLKDGGSTYKIAIVLYVLKDSPAEEAGLKDTPFLKDSVYTYGNKRIGYLMYNHFASGPDEYDYSDTSYNLYLQQLFEKFQSRNVNEFVLDLRYNGGGLVNCAQLLASLLVRENVLGEPLCIMEYNDKNSNKNETLPLLKTTEVMAGNLNLQRLFVLTGSTTASASELIINSLRSYLDVRVIGKQTFGKTVGMTIYNESKKYGWILSPVTFHIYNKDREADYEDGFHPDIAIDEFKSDLAEFGDLKDPLLGQAIYEITGQSPLLRSATPRGNREIQYNPPLSYKDNLLLIPKD